MPTFPITSPKLSLPRTPNNISGILINAFSYMPQSPNTELESAAERLIKWDERRARTAEFLHYDVTLVRREKAEKPDPWATGDPRAIPSAIVSLLMARATTVFCKAASATLGAERLPAEDMISPDRFAGGHARDPLIEFPSGLILRSVAAADYVLHQSADVAPGSLQTS